MRMLTTCGLISFTPDAHEVGTQVTEKTRWVKCQEMGLTQADVFQAGGEGLSPEAKLLIPYDRDYEGEREMMYRGERWSVIRCDPYKEYNGVLLSIGRKKGNSRPGGGNAVTQAASTAGAGQEAGSGDE